MATQSKPGEETSAVFWARKIWAELGEVVFYFFSRVSFEPFLSVSSEECLVPILGSVEPDISVQCSKIKYLLLYWGICVFNGNYTCLFTKLWRFRICIISSWSRPHFLVAIVSFVVCKLYVQYFSCHLPLHTSDIYCLPRFGSLVLCLFWHHFYNNWNIETTFGNKHPF